MGLGNPGPAYKNTYHNAGKLMVDYLSEIFGSKNYGHNVSFCKKTISGLFESRQARVGACLPVGTGQVGDVVLVKPFNYMNENGKAAKLALKSFGIGANSLLVIHDDSDLEIGKYKISFGRGSAGHNGVKSVIESIGSKDFWRLRIGVRKSRITEASKTNPPSLKLRRARAGEFVLKKITETGKKTMASAFEKSTKEIFGKNIISL